MKQRVGILGCAGIASRSMGPALLAEPAFTLAAVASRTAQRADQFAAKFCCDAVAGYNELLRREDIDAVYVPLPTGLHCEWVRASLNAGKHVLVEKSLTTDGNRAAELVALARSKSLVLMENFMFLRHSQHRRVKQLLDTQAIGDLRVFASEFAFPPRPPDDIRYQAALGGGALLDTGAYTVRCAQLFLGSQLEVAGSVTAVDRAAGVDVWGSALLISPSGVPAHLSFGFDHAYRCNYTLWGTHGRLHLDRAFTSPADFVPRVKLEHSGGQEVLALEPDDHFAGAVRHFAGLIAGTRDRSQELDACLRQAVLLDEIRKRALLVACGPINPSF